MALVTEMTKQTTKKATLTDNDMPNRAHRRVPPFNRPEFWVAEMNDRLKNVYMSTELRARYTELRDSEQQKIQQQPSLHYPRIRK
jgi:hypothetical protein